MIEVPESLTLVAYGLTMKPCKAHPYGDAYYLEVPFLQTRWCPFPIPHSDAFNSEPEALENFKKKYLAAKEKYISEGGEDFKDPDFRIHSIYG